MAPRVEAPETSNEHINHFLIDLQAPVPFDAALFEELAKRVNYRQTIDTSMLKYVVVNRRMWVFSEKQIHFGFYDQLKQTGENGKLQSAGAITVYYYSAEIHGTVPPRRKIEGWSSSLVPELSKTTSDEYKSSELKKTLDEFFVIE